MKDSTATVGTPGPAPTPPRRTREIEREAADWIAAREGSAWTVTRQAQLDDWLAASTAHRVAYLRLLHTWQRADRLQVLRPQPQPAQALRQPVPAPARTPWWHPGRWITAPTGWGLGAGALASVALVAILGLRLPELTGQRGEAHVTTLGQQAVVRLGDGSRITLNTATRIRADMDDRGRHVWLDSGEAYFEIAHDPSRPFVVEVGRQRVTVLGTKFSLRRDGERLRVQVVEGRVQVMSASGASALLAAADMAVATPSSLQLQHESPQTVEGRMGWLQGQLRLDGMTLEQAAAEFNRYNQRQLHISDARIGATRIGGTFDATNVEAFARLLHAGFGLSVQEGADAIMVGPPD